VKHTHTQTHTQRHRQYYTYNQTETHTLRETSAAAVRPNLTRYKKIDYYWSLKRNSVQQHQY